MDNTSLYSARRRDAKWRGRQETRQAGAARTGFAGAGCTGRAEHKTGGLAFRLYRLLAIQAIAPRKCVVGKEADSFRRRDAAARGDERFGSIPRSKGWSWREILVTSSTRRWSIPATPGMKCGRASIAICLG